MSHRVPFKIYLLITLIVGGVIGLSAAVGTSSAADPAPKRLWTERADTPSGIAPDAALDMSSFARLAKELNPTVVHITVTKKIQAARMPRGTFEFFRRQYGAIPREFENKGLGSGFVINSDGYILTNYHVIEDGDEISVRFAGGDTYDATVVGADPPTDIALLRIDDTGKALPVDLKVAPLGDSDALAVGEWVLVIGNPFGLSHTVTAGIVSAKGRKDIAPGGRHLIASFIQTDASINPGNSGGPVFNVRGEVIGMASAMNASGQGIGFAIPINMIKTLLPQLRQGHVERSWLGVMIRPVTDDHVAALGLPSAKGAIIARVVPDGPGARGGLEPGDVVVGFNGRPVDSAVDLQWLASIAAVHSPVDVEVFRRGERRTLSVELEAMPERFMAHADLPGLRSRGKGDTGGQTIVGVGLRVNDVTRSLRKRLHLRSPQGAVVTDVDAGSPAAAAGLKPGDVILVVGTSKVKDAASFRRSVAKVRPGSLISLVVVRNGETQFIDLKRAR